MEKDGRLPDSAVHGIIAFTFATFLVLAALWPASPSTTVGPAPAVMPGAPPASGGADVPAMSNIVGLEPYDGPVTAQEVVASCAPDLGAKALPCYEQTLLALLRGRGAIAAFDALENLTSVDRTVSGQGHALAHDLGRYAFVAYGSIQTALENCSYKAFQGCFHGAIEAYFDRLSDIEQVDLSGICPAPDSYRQSLCVHGIGHGLMLVTNANVNRSLELCGKLDPYNAQSCWSGVFMENLVGFSDMQSGAHHQHDDGEPGYMVQRAGDPYYPCSVVASQYQPTCWVQMADYLLHFNNSDFNDTAQKCDSAPSPSYVVACRQRIGTDSYAWYHDVELTLRHCSFGDPQYRSHCVKGMAADIVLYSTSPSQGIQVCNGLPEDDKAACFQEVASQGVNMVGRESMGAVCAAADPAYVQMCRSNAGLGVDA